MRKSTADDVDDEEIIVVDMGLNTATVHPAAERSPSHVSYSWFFFFFFFGKVIASRLAKFTLKASRARYSVQVQCHTAHICFCSAVE